MLASSPQELCRLKPGHRASRKKKTVTARWVCNQRLLGAVQQQVFSATNGSPGARAYYDELRARRIGHHAVLRQLSNRLVGILHGCLKTRTLYDETTAWGHRATSISTATTTVTPDGAAFQT
jgi:hypothetical protein